MLSLLFGVASASQLSASEEADFAKFQSWVQEHQKEYSTVEEFAKRFGAFREFLKLADERNAANMAAGGEDNVHGVTIFADLTQQEFRDTYLMKPGFYQPRLDNDFEIPAINTTAGNVDWRNQGVVTAVKDQGQCGSCWAFSATEAVESFGQLDVNYGLTPLSAQQSCSCTYSYNGCNGGNPQNVYKTAIQNYGGEESNSDYPYTQNCGTCQVSSSKKKYVSTNGYTNVAKGQLQATLDKQGPPSVAVAAESWNTYHGGVMTSCVGSIDHAVQAVGYTSSGVSTPYWVVRNSWGTSWGVQGYIYLDMSGDTCKVQDDINYPYGAPAS
jgi:Pyruvate/2-oxoacid:ferredoxin oxidoreductase delta subunit